MSDRHTKEQSRLPPLERSMDPLLIALGATCQCTYQVRRFTALERASYFDWLGTTHTALVTALRLRLDGLFRRENLVLAREGMTVIDKLTGISYRHAFRWQHGSKLIEPTSLESDYAAQRDKYAFLTERWFHDLQVAPVLFVRHDGPTPDEARELALALAPFCGNTFQLLFVTGDPDSAHRLEKVHPNVHATALDPQDGPHPHWQGSNKAWDRILSRYAQPGVPSALRPAFARELTHGEKSVLFPNLPGMPRPAIVPDA